MLKVLMVSEFYPPRIGGVEKFVRGLSEGLVSRGHDCTVLCTSDHDADENLEGVRVLRSRNFPVEFHGVNLGFRRLLASILPDKDIVHIHSFYPFISYVAARLCVRRAIPYVFSPHYHGQGHSMIGSVLFRAYMPLGRYIMRNAARIHCNSEYEREIVERDFTEYGPIEVISPGTEPPQKLNDERDGRIVFVGRMETYKGAQRVMDIAVELHERDKLTGVIFIGGGPELERLMERSKEEGIEDHVEFLSGLDDDELQSIVGRSSLLILLSDAEAYGLVVSEALACGTPCMVSDRMALKEFACIPGCLVYEGDYDTTRMTDAAEEMLDRRMDVGPLTDKVPCRSRVAELFESLYLKAIDGDSCLRK